MYTLLICCIIGVLIALYLLFHSEPYGNISIMDKIGFSFIHSLLGGLIGIIGGLIVSTIILFIGVASDNITKKQEFKCYIENVQDNSHISGSFFIGSGTIDQKPVYSYYAAIDDGYVLCTIETSKCKVVYTDKKPYVSQTVPITNSKFYNNFALLTFAEKYIIHIPKGSIKHDFILDAK